MEFGGDNIKGCRELRIRKTGIWWNSLAKPGGESVFMGAKTQSGYCYTIEK